MLRRSTTFAILVFTLSLGVFALDEYRRSQTEYFLAADPYWNMLATRSLLQDGNLDLKDEHEHNVENASDQIALGVRGEWYPLHEWLLSVGAVPAYAAFSEGGLLFLNMLVAASLVVTTFSLCRQFTSPQAAFAASSLLGVASSVREYSFSFSNDLFGTFLVIGSFYAVFVKRPVLSGFLIGLAVLARLNSIVFLPFVIVAAIALAGRRGLLRSTAGGLLPAAVFFLSNWWMFGSPLTVSYNRWAPVQNGELVLAPQVERFEGISSEKIGSMLFHAKTGAVTGSPLFALGLLLGTIPLYRKSRLMAGITVASWIVATAYFSSFQTLYPGLKNRYFLVPVCLSAVPLAALLDAIRKFVTQRRSDLQSLQR